jgi:hypothetical protein
MSERFSLKRKMSLKVDLTCSYCSKILKDLVELPCQDLICKEHLKEKEVIQKNKIKCRECKKEFQIKSNEFKSIKVIQKQIDNQIYLSDEEIALKQKIEESIKVFYEIYEEFASSRTKLDLVCHNHFQEVRREIDLHREKLKEKIDCIYMEMIEKIKEDEALYLRSLNEKLDNSLKSFEIKSLHEDLREIEEKFRDPNLLFESIEETQIKKQTALKTLQSYQNECTKEESYLKSSYKFKPFVRFNQKLFGQLHSISGEYRFKSEILTCQQPFELIKLCEFTQMDKFKLLYRASKDGFGSKDFHSKCDGKANTLTILKANGFIFGGFTTATWDSSGKYKTDPNAFLFSLTNKDNKPCKMKIDSSQHEYAILCKNEYGPIFGFNDVCILNNSNIIKNSFSYLGHTYKHTQYAARTNEAKSFLAETFEFQLDEIEVYQKE